MGEVVSIQQADQFQPGKSAYECGFFAVMMARSMNELGKPPTLSPGEIVAKAEDAYARYDGSNASWNMDGMSLQQLYDLLHEVGLHYQGLPLDTGLIKGWLQAGYPVIVSVAETSVHDVELGRNPYPWTPAGNHVIILTGLEGNNYLVRDSANIEPPNTLRPGPRVYSPDLLYVSATVVVPPWKSRPTSVNPPTPERTTTVTIPSGWKDDGTTLTAPNGVKVVKGFRTHVLNSAWDPNNYPLEEEHEMGQLEVSNPALGSGTQQAFRMNVLEWTSARGVFGMWTGQELLALRKEIELLKAQPNQRQPPIPPDVHGLLVAIVNATQPLADANAKASQILKELP